MSWCSRTHWMLGLVLAPVLASCGDAAPIFAPTVNQTQVLAAVTPELAASLDGNGKFVFGEPVGGNVPWISAARARELAVAYWTRYGGSLAPQLAARRKAPVSANVSPCRRVFLAESGYDEFPVEYPRDIRRTYGPTWIVSFCSGSEQQAAIAVSVESTDLTIDEAGFVHGHKPGDFQPSAVPEGAHFPAEPEVGTVGVVAVVGAKVSALPRYRRLAQRYDSFSGIWTFQVESPVRMQGTRSGIEIDTNMVDFSPWSSPRDLRPVMANQDSAGKARLEIFSSSIDGVTWTTHDAYRRISVPVALEPFTVARNP